MASVVQQKYSYIKLQRKSLNRHNTVRQYLNCSQVYLSWLSVSVVWKVSSLSGIVTVSLNIQAFSSPIQTHLQCEVAEMCLEWISPTRQTGKPIPHYLIFSPVNSSLCGGVKRSAWHISHLMEVVLNMCSRTGAHTHFMFILTARSWQNSTGKLNKQSPLEAYLMACSGAFDCITPSLSADWLQSAVMEL